MREELRRPDRLLRREVDHLAYVVEDIPTAVEGWARLGVGPFFQSPNVEFEVLHRRDEPCVFEHSAAFARWGDIGLELQQIHRSEPPELARELGCGRGNGLNHVAYASPNPEGDSARLEELGFPESVYCQAGPIEDRMHHVPALGHMIEIHLASDSLAGFWAAITEGSRGWDGSDPLRPMDVPS